MQGSPIQTRGSQGQGSECNEVMPASWIKYVRSNQGYMYSYHPGQESFHEKSESILAIYGHAFPCCVPLSTYVDLDVRLATTTTIAHEPDDLLALSSVSLSPTFHCFISCLFVRGPKARRLAKKPPSKLPRGAIHI